MLSLLGHETIWKCGMATPTLPTWESTMLVGVDY